MCALYITLALHCYLSVELFRAITFDDFVPDPVSHSRIAIFDVDNESHRVYWSRKVGSFSVGSFWCCYALFDPEYLYDGIQFLQPKPRMLCESKRSRSSGQNGCAVSDKLRRVDVVLPSEQKQSIKCGLRNAVSDISGYLKIFDLLMLFYY